MRLTKRDLDAATYTGANNARCVLWDDEVPGFGCRIFPSGKRAFILSYRAAGKSRLLTIGSYGALTLDQARKAARSELAKVEVEGADPVEARRQRADEAASLEPLRTLLDEYAATLTNAGTAADARQSFAKNVPTRLSGKPARDVTTADVEGILSKVRERGALAVERNLFRFLHAAFEFGTGNQDRKRRFRIAGNPVTEAERPEGSAPAGDRELSAAEIRELWRRLDSAGMSLETATVLRLQVRTGQRVQEILNGDQGPGAEPRPARRGEQALRPLRLPAGQACGPGRLAVGGSPHPGRQAPVRRLAEVGAPLREGPGQRHARPAVGAAAG